MPKISSPLGRWRGIQSIFIAGILASAFLNASAQDTNLPAQTLSATPSCSSAKSDTAYIPVDSWVYPAILRLYSMGYLQTVYIGERPWTRAAVGSMLDEAARTMEEASDYDVPSLDEAQKIYQSLVEELHYSPANHCLLKEENLHVESVYSSTRVLTGTSLRDSFHLGSTMINDYGRPYANGVNNYSGFSGYATAGRFLVYLRGEFQETPSTEGYSSTLAQRLATSVDGLAYTNSATGVPYYQATIPAGEIAGHRSFNPLEAYVSTHLWNHEISFGRKDEWLSPAQGGAFAYSNNAQNLYALHIDRQKPLYVPALSRLTGPFRYEFLVGEVQGHTYMAATPNNWVNPGKPWIHVEKVSLKPTSDFEVSFERTVIWGGQGHEGINLHSFLRSFFSVTAPQPPQKNSNRDPGSRYGAFTLSYRLPFVRNWLTFYADGEAHDDVCSCDSPRRAAWRPGFYLSHLPKAQKFDLRTEFVWTDPPITNSQNGQFMYWENMDRQGYTNKGQIFGDWIGREDKGGQAWVTYHLSGNEMIQLAARHQKADKDFISGGTTLNDFGVQAVKRIGKDFEVNGTLTREQWKAPIYMPGAQSVWATTVQLTWFPKK
ncbi:capsule assembly Wzi family protein [Telmatobacter bradus]|uniref:capsule assembly Wzi family protein n=1 Tax=Telmatobacter bradus TaxID=474953 RepID=UPI003B4388B8